jgi:hypothetical protein
MKNIMQEIVSLETRAAEIHYGSFPYHDISEDNKTELIKTAKKEIDRLVYGILKDVWKPTDDVMITLNRCEKCNKL